MRTPLLALLGLACAAPVPEAAIRWTRDGVEQLLVRDTGALGPPVHLALGRELVQAVPDDANRWATPTTVTLGPLHWEAQAKCSGLVGRLIEAAAGVDLRDRWDCDTSVPLAWHWHARLTESALADPALVPLPTVFDLAPGDVLALAYTACDRAHLTCGRENGACDGGSTGHVAFVDGVPSPQQVGAHLWWDVPVLDAARSGHSGDLDTRWRDGAWQDGAGRGVLRLVSDAHGVPIGHAWSATPDSRLVPHTEAAIALGRWLEVP